jgi:predicted glycosyltransferase
VFRPPPEGALYHPMVNERFEDVLRSAQSRDEVQIVLLPRTREQAERYRSRSGRIRVPEHAVDARSLLALADLAIGGGGTMNRERPCSGLRRTHHCARTKGSPARPPSAGAPNPLRARARRAPSSPEELCR